MLPWAPTKLRIHGSMAPLSVPLDAIKCLCMGARAGSDRPSPASQEYQTRRPEGGGNTEGFPDSGNILRSPPRRRCFSPEPRNRSTHGLSIFFFFFQNGARAATGGLSYRDMSIGN